MSERDELVTVFTGTEVSAIMLKGLLEEIGVPALIRDDYKSGIDIGFIGGTPSTVDLLIKESDLDKSAAVVKEFLERDEPEQS